jgi:hypothetical protein
MPRADTLYRLAMILSALGAVAALLAALIRLGQGALDLRSLSQAAFFAGLAVLLRFLRRQHRASLHDIVIRLREPASGSGPTRPPALH